ncbi:MAG: LysE family translocator [Desulfovibrio sp.]
MLDNYWAFLVFVIIMTGTPGPGNLTMMAIGQTTGFKSAIPFLIGTVLGGVFIDTLVATGLIHIFLASPLLNRGFQIVGVVYIVYLAVKVLRMHMKTVDAPKTFTFYEGLLIHPLSPKTWAMNIAGFSQFANPEAPMFMEVTLFVGSFTMGAIVFHSLWCVAGATMHKWLRSPRVSFCANCLMACLMVGATVYAMVT